MQAVLKKCLTAQLTGTKVAQHSIHNTSVQVPVQFVCTCPIHAQSSANNVSISLEEVLNCIYCDDELLVQGRQPNYANVSLIMMAVHFSWGMWEVPKMQYYLWIHFFCSILCIFLTKKIIYFVPKLTSCHTKFWNTCFLYVGYTQPNNSKFLHPTCNMTFYPAI